MVLAILISTLAGFLWIIGLAILLVKSIRPSDTRTSHKEGSIIVFFTAFPSSIFISTKVGDSPSEVTIARICLAVLVVFFLTFFIALNEVVNHHA